MNKNILAGLCSLGLLAGCGTQTLIAGLFVYTPAVTFTPPPVQDVQPAPITVGPYSTLLGYVTTIDTSSVTNFSSSSVAPVTGVKATLAFESCLGLTPQATQDACIASGHGGTDRVLTVPGSDSSPGLYQLLSTDDPHLTFEQGVTYTLILEVPDSSTTFEAYGARFQPGPPAHMVEFANKSAPVLRAAGNQTDLTVHRDDAMVDGKYLPAAILVGTIDPANPTAQPKIVWSSLDYTDPKTLALLALSDQPYRVSSITIPAMKIAAPGFYVVTMVSLSEGKASENAFLASTVLAGSGDAGLLWVQ